MKTPKTTRVGTATIACIIALATPNANAAVLFSRDFAPQQGLVAPMEKPYRDEICLNGSWQFQPVDLPSGYKPNTGVAPDLTPPVDTAWDKTPIRIPSPWNVNAFPDQKGLGGDFRCFPSYPAVWEGAKMGWLRRSFKVPVNWKGRRILLHFGAVAGDTQVLVNGKELARHFDIHLPFDIDVSDAVKLGADNDLLVGVRKASLFDLPGKYGKRRYQAGSMWGESIAGIWQDVYLEGVPSVRISDVFVKQQVDAGLLVADVTVQNDTDKDVTISASAAAYPWVSDAGSDVLSSPEPVWHLAKPAAINCPSITSAVPAHGSAVIALASTVSGRLKYWTPDSPNLYGLVCTLSGASMSDAKYTRFGWRQVTLKGSQVLLNGKPIIMKGDSWHFIGIPEMTRRYAWAWFRAAKDAHLNAVRLHAEPYPPFFLDIADEQGMLVLDEDAVWGSGGGPKVDDPSFWTDTERHLTDLVLRDRNHPCVFGWSVSNEMMAVVRGVFHAPADIQDNLIRYDGIWKDICRKNDPTREWISADGEDDAGGVLPAYVVHYGGSETMKRATASGKPWGVGEAGPAYYGTPEQIEQMAADPRAYLSTLDRMEGVAVVSYNSLMDQNRLGGDYRSVFNLVWYGLKPLNLGMADTTRPPALTDGITFGPYVEGKAGVQPERLGPYCTTLNPGYDPALPLYQTWPLFDAIRDASADPPLEYKPDRALAVDSTKPSLAGTIKAVGLLAGDGGSLGKALVDLGVTVAPPGVDPPLVFVDGATPPTAEANAHIQKTLENGGTVFVWGANSTSLVALNALLPFPMGLTDRTASSLVASAVDPLVAGLSPASMYFSELSSPVILPAGLAGPLIDKAIPLLVACDTNWQRWNNQPELTKTSMLLRSEREAKPSGVALASLTVGKGRLIVCNVSPDAQTSKAAAFNRVLLSNLGIALGDSRSQRNTLNAAAQVIHALACGQFGAATVDDALSQSPVRTSQPTAIVAGAVAKNHPWVPVDSDASGAMDLKPLAQVRNVPVIFSYMSAWIYSPKDLNNLLLDPHLPNIDLAIGNVSMASAWLNGRSINAVAASNGAIARTVLFQSGWNHILVKAILTQDSTAAGPSLKLLSSQPDILGQMRGAEEKP